MSLFRSQQGKARREAAASGEAEAAAGRARMSGGQPAQRHCIYCSAACATLDGRRRSQLTFRGL